MIFLKIIPVRMIIVSVIVDAKGEIKRNLELFWLNLLWKKCKEKEVFSKNYDDKKALGWSLVVTDKTERLHQECKYCTSLKIVKIPAESEVCVLMTS